MKPIKILITLFLFSLVLMGCPYSAEVPIDKPAIKVDIDLIKSWNEKLSKDYSYKVLKEDEYTYKIEKNKISSGELTIYFGYISNIDGIKYFNIWEDGSESKSYYFYKYEKDAKLTQISLTPVTENIDETFTSSKDLFNFFRKNQVNSYFFDKESDDYVMAE